jgi:hypothetical protein
MAYLELSKGVGVLGHAKGVPAGVQGVIRAAAATAAAAAAETSSSSRFGR